MAIFCNYMANKEYIAKNLCENRSKPQLKCNGKCYLAKQLKKADKKENNAPLNAKEKSEIVPGVLNKIQLSPIQTAINIPFLPYLQAYSNCNPGDIFHPPLFC